MTIENKLKLDYIEKKGIKRVVLPREMKKEEIESLKTNMELEIFVRPRRRDRPGAAPRGSKRHRPRRAPPGARFLLNPYPHHSSQERIMSTRSRSEERRVGKECRSRW